LICIAWRNRPLRRLLSFQRVAPATRRENAAAPPPRALWPPWSMIATILIFRKQLSRDWRPGLARARRLHQLEPSDCRAPRTRAFPSPKSESERHAVTPFHA
jgi:hypothetical protein